MLAGGACDTSTFWRSGTAPGGAGENMEETPGKQEQDPERVHDGMHFNRDFHPTSGDFESFST